MPSSTSTASGTSPDYTQAESPATAENGGGKAANAVFAGFLQDSDYPLAFIVVVEEGGGGASVCTPILSQVLSACVVAMDAD